MNERRKCGRRREDEGSFDFPTSILVALVVMATLAIVSLLTTL